MVLIVHIYIKFKILRVIFIIIVYEFLAPSSPPANVLATATSSISINVIWDEVPPIDQNGVITMYEILYIPLNDFGGLISANTTNVSKSDFNATLLDLQEYVNYTISVRPYTSEGPGPYSPSMIVLTLEDSEFASILD